MSDDVSIWFAPAVGLGGAALVAAANYLVQRWRYKADRLAAAVDHLCSEINSAADVATDYWLLDATQKEESKTAKQKEPVLTGRQMRIQELWTTLPAYHEGAATEPLIDERIADFFDAMTAGDFGVDKRAPDPQRAREVQALAAILNGLLRAFGATIFANKLGHIRGHFEREKASFRRLIGLPSVAPAPPRPPRADL